MEQHPSAVLTPPDTASIDRSQQWFASELPTAARAPAQPVFARGSMVARPWSLSWRALWSRPASLDSGEPSRDRATRIAGARRRRTLLTLILVPTLMATWFMADALPDRGRAPLEAMVVALFGVLFAWVSAGFWTALMGFGVLLRKHDRFAISRHDATHATLGREARTAVIMPICNENVATVFAGLRATIESTLRAGVGEHFEFFVLSDSSDPDTRVAELAAWKALCSDLGLAGRVHYRWRRVRTKRKAGNVADFCRRWGRGFRYMVVLDADSVMTGECLATLVRLMESHPSAGIIQTAPRTAGKESLHARAHQFASRVYGPIFTAGLHFWQLSESHYWGHNAILRIEPFMRHCALAPLPGDGALSGEIMSHDFVEAALMRRAGWGVWIAYDLPGSYEQVPPTLDDELTRDRRWCHGNLQNFRLFFEHGLHPVHRGVFLTGAMAYLTAPLWLLFLVLATALLALHAMTLPQYFVQPYQLFPLWPHANPTVAFSLLGATIAMLYLPKSLAVALPIVHGEARRYGGALALVASAIVEAVLSALLAPVRMMFHARFVFAALTGWRIDWRSPPRDDASTSWRDAARRHGTHTVLGLLWGAAVAWFDPAFFWWLLPVAGALALSIPVSVYTSRADLGRFWRARGLFLIPEEFDPPGELRRAAYLTAHAGRPEDFVAAVVDVRLREIVANASRHTRVAHGLKRTHLVALVRRAVLEGPAGLTSREKMTLLEDPAMLTRLHREVWSRPDAHRTWLAHGLARRSITAPLRSPRTEITGEAVFTG